MKYNLIKHLLFVFFIWIAGTTAAAFEEKGTGVNEFWQEAYLYTSFSEKLRGEVLYNNLYSQSLGNYDWFLEGKLTYSANPWLDVELLYRHEFYDFEGSKVQEYRPMFRISGKKQWGNWLFRNRHRFEYRMFEVESSQFRYRSDLKIKPEWNWTSIDINPYIMDEVFVAREKLTRNRIYGGLEAKKGRFEPAAYMLIQSDKISEDWHNRFIVGVVLGIEL